MAFDIITIFPNIFNSYFNESILKRAQKKGLIKIGVYDLRRWASDRHKTVDDKPYGGGPGMIFKVEPLFKAVTTLKKLKILPRGKSRGKNEKLKIKERIILFSTKGRLFTQADALRLSKYDHLILICGRYEGVDERVAEHIVDEELSVGNFVLTGGEIPAMIVVDAVARLIPGVLGKKESLAEESFSKTKNYKLKTNNYYLEYPQYTRPENFRGWKVPKVLLSGDHKKIREWRFKNSKFKNQNDNSKCKIVKFILNFTLSFCILIFAFCIMLYIAADHAGYPLKEELKSYLQELGFEIVDLGNEQLDPSDDYPDFAYRLARNVLDNEGSRGILICGTGQGMCIAANKVDGIRAALIHDEFTARTAVEHLNTNVICLGGRVTDPEVAKKLVKIWLETEFSGEERHERRLEKIQNIEKS